MANEKVKLKVRWGNNKPGDVIPLSPDLLDFAIRKGFAEKVIEPEYQKKVIEPKSKKK